MIAASIPVVVTGAVMVIAMRGGFDPPYMPSSYPPPKPVVSTEEVVADLKAECIVERGYGQLPAGARLTDFCETVAIHTIRGKIEK